MLCWDEPPLNSPVFMSLELHQEEPPNQSREVRVDWLFVGEGVFESALYPFQWKQLLQESRNRERLCGGGVSACSPPVPSLFFLQFPISQEIKQMTPQNKQLILEELFLKVLKQVRALV